MSAPLRAILLLLAAQVFFNLLDATAKHLVGDYSIVAVTWARYLFLLLFTAGYLALAGERGVLRARHWRLQIARGLVLIAFSGCLIATLKYLPQAEAAAISFVAPLVILVLAGPLLGERVRPARWVAVGCGLAGMLIVVRPGAGLSGIGIAFAIGTLVSQRGLPAAHAQARASRQPVHHRAAVGADRHAGHHGGAAAGAARPLADAVAGGAVRVVRHHRHG